MELKNRMYYRGDHALFQSIIREGIGMRSLSVEFLPGKLHFFARILGCLALFFVLVSVHSFLPSGPHVCEL
jgi:hypothetical protein